MVLIVGEEKVVFKLQEAMRHLMDCDDFCYFLDHVDYCDVDFLHDSQLGEKLNDLLIEDSMEKIQQKGGCDGCKTPSLRRIGGSG